MTRKPATPKVQILEHRPADKDGLVSMVFRALIPTPEGKRKAKFGAVYRESNPAEHSVGYYTDEYYDTNGASCSIPHAARVEATRLLLEAAEKAKKERELCEVARRDGFFTDHVRGVRRSSATGEVLDK